LLLPLPKSASNNLRKWFLSPTGRLNFGFITEGKLAVVLITPYSWGSQLVYAPVGVDTLPPLCGEHGANAAAYGGRYHLLNHLGENMFVHGPEERAHDLLIDVPPRGVLMFRGGDRILSGPGGDSLRRLEDACIDIAEVALANKIGDN
jgi:hypothetical protein